MAMIDPRSFPKRWGRAVSSGAPSTVLSLYAPNAVLVPTYGASILQGHKEMEGYFREFLARPNMRVMVTEVVMRRTGPNPVLSGFYSFTWGSGGPKERAAARYTFVLQPKRAPSGQIGWVVITHHSSVVP